MSVIGELSQLLFPTRCYGCNAIGLSICSSCRREWHPHFYTTHVQGIKVHSAVIYSPTASRIIMAAKERGLKGADELIVDAIVHVLDKANFDAFNLRLVPIPSSAPNRRRRGRSFIPEICKQVSAITSIPVIPALTINRAVKDQSSLSAKARLTNMRGAFSISTNTHPRGDLILIDDVVTTGATVSEAARALNSQGFHVLASVTACLAQPLR
jgi:predicted amidophosphoribosyltransferase